MCIPFNVFYRDLISEAINLMSIKYRNTDSNDISCMVHDVLFTSSIVSKHVFGVNVPIKKTKTVNNVV